VERLQTLAQTACGSFRRLAEVVQAHAERFPNDGRLGRPERTLQALQTEGFSTFEALFAEFSRREGVYGFGDLQVKSLLDQLS
jgi:hypothetical protein